MDTEAYRIEIEAQEHEVLARPLTGELIQYNSVKLWEANIQQSCWGGVAITLDLIYQVQTSKRHIKVIGRARAQVIFGRVD